MNKIKILPDNLANQIAAGEVVERPASVVKELLENSIDAGAKRISVEIELGGRRLIRISDDGEGMNRDDAVLAFERHATSKISKLEDLTKIDTLGFRGEALASISSVAKVELTTNTSDSSIATRVQIEGGRIIDVKDAARSHGTTISVRDLFFNIPARRKFMRSEATENFHIINIVTHYAIAHPEISFVLTNNGRESIRVSPAKDLRERAFQLLGASILESLLEISGGREYIAKVSGYISAPRERRTNRDSQYFFINGRFVKDKLLSRALLEGYRNVLPHGVYPMALLFLEIPLEEVDVNVHPAKTEVRFRRTEAVKDVIAEAVKKTLESSNLFDRMLTVQQVNDRVDTQTNPGDSSFFEKRIKSEESSKLEQSQIDFLPNEQVEDFTLHAAAREGSRQITQDEERSTFQGNNSQFDLNKPEITFRDSRENIPSRQEIQNVYKTISPIDSALKATKEIEIDQLNLTKIQPVGQLHQSYIIAVDNQGLLLIDQHVAHERILFDKFRKKEGERKIESQNLLLPETLDLTPAQAAAYELVEEELENLGFSIMRLSGRTIAVKAVPGSLPPSEVRNLLAEILDTVEMEKKGNAIETIRDGIAASLACKAAVKVNMKLTAEKMQWMIDNLVTNSAATTCPHGRPIILRLTMRDIERSFHRT